MTNSTRSLIMHRFFRERKWCQQPPREILIWNALLVKLKDKHLEFGAKLFRQTHSQKVQVLPSNQSRLRRDRLRYCINSYKSMIGKIEEILNS